MQTTQNTEVFKSTELSKQDSKKFLSELNKTVKKNSWDNCTYGVN